jgi:hypothetical protein
MFPYERMGLSLMNILGLSPIVGIALIACYCKCLLLHYTQALCQYRLCIADLYVSYVTTEA